MRLRDLPPLPELLSKASILAGLRVLRAQGGTLRPMIASPLNTLYPNYGFCCAAAADPNASAETLKRLADHPVFLRYEGSLLERLLLRHPNLPHEVMESFYERSRWPLLLNSGFLLFVLVKGKSDVDERLRHMTADLVADRMSVRWSEGIERRFVALVAEAMRQHVQASGEARACDRDSLLGGDEVAWRTRYAEGMPSGPSALCAGLLSAFRMPTHGHVHPGLLLALSAADLVATAPVTFVRSEKSEIDPPASDDEHALALATVDSWFDSPRLPSLRSTIPASGGSTTPPADGCVPIQKTPVP